MVDVSFAGFSGIAEVLDALNREFQFVPANHDERSTLRRLYEKGFAVIEPPLKEFKAFVHQADGTNVVHRFVLCHFPMRVWNRMHYGAMRLLGHYMASAATRTTIAG
jgi:calcineurin-like phosphoesterase family protein